MRIFRGSSNGGGRVAATYMTFFFFFLLFFRFQQSSIPSFPRPSHPPPAEPRCRSRQPQTRSPVPIVRCCRRFQGVSKKKKRCTKFATVILHYPLNCQVTVTLPFPTFLAFPIPLKHPIMMHHAAFQKTSSGFPETEWLPASPEWEPVGSALRMCMYTIFPFHLSCQNATRKECQMCAFDDGPEFGVGGPGMVQGQKPKRSLTRLGNQAHKHSSLRITTRAHPTKSPVPDEGTWGKNGGTRNQDETKRDETTRLKTGPNGTRETRD